MVHPYHGTPLSNAKESTIDVHNNLDGSGGIYAEWKKPVSKGYAMYYFYDILMTFLKRQN